MPPKFWLRFFRWYCHPDYVEDLEGDLLERFERSSRGRSYRSAKWRFTKDVFKLFRPGIMRPLFKTDRINKYVMITHNLKVGYRNLLKNKGYSYINIGGLAVGLMVTMLIGLWVVHELNFNKVHKNYERIARVMQRQHINNQIYTEEAMPLPMGDELRDKFGDDFDHVIMSSWNEKFILSHNNKGFSQTGRFMEAGAPQLLALEMLQGSRDALKDPTSIVLSETSAQIIFGDINPINKELKIGNQLDVIVRGVYKDVPPNSNFKELSFIASWDLYLTSEPWLTRAKLNPQWDDNSFNVFVQVAEKSSIDATSKRIRSVKYDNLRENQKLLNTEVFLHPMAEWRLRSYWENGVNAGGPIIYVWLFSSIGIFVLLLACINFINLGTAQSAQRAKEVGVRKSLGSAKGQLIRQFMGETVLIVFIAFVLSLALVLIALPGFNQLSESQISLPYSSWSFWLSAFSIIMLVSVVSGSYPAFYLSSLQPIRTLKGAGKTGLLGATLRKSLVVSQFTVSVILIIGTLAVIKQVEHTKDRPLGYDKDGTIMIEMSSPEYYGKFNILKTEFMNQNAIEAMAQSSSPLTDNWNSNDGFTWKEKSPEFAPYFNTVWVTPEYGKTVGWQVLKGRDYSEDLASDKNAYIINEAAVEYMGLENPVSTVMRWHGGTGHEVIGVVKNMLTESPFQSIAPTIYMIDQAENNTNFYLMKLNPNETIQKSLSSIENTINKLVPGVPFEYQFTDQQHARKFAAEERIGKLSGMFALLAIFISCIGLFGMVSFMTEKRTKEVGIRKVLGASVLSLWQLLSKESLALVLISCILALPIAYYGVDQWLQNYTYKTTLDWSLFAIAVFGAFAITLFTVSFKSVKTARMNPANIIKSE